MREHGAGTPPAGLRSTAGGAGPKLGRGVGYDNPHNERTHVNDQEHFPAGLETLRFYAPDDAEAEYRDRLARIRKARGRD